MHILIIEDADILRQSLITGLESAGYSVDATSDGKEGLWRAIEYEYDLILLDIMLPNLDGFSLLNQLRKNNKDTLVLILTAKDTVEDRVRGLRDGADDYLVKPFNYSELLARVECLFRRRYGLKHNRIEIRHITIDIESKEISLKGERLELPPREYALLEYLILNRNRVVSRMELESRIYGDHSDPVSNVVNSTISTLRKKIDLPHTPSLIETRRGFGYKMAEQ